MNARVDVLGELRRVIADEREWGDREDAERVGAVYEVIADLLEATPRAIQMLHVAGARAISFSPERITNYDDADCDGYCVHSDCIAAITDLQRALARIGAD